MTLSLLELAGCVEPMEVAALSWSQRLIVRNVIKDTIDRLKQIESRSKPFSDTAGCGRRLKRKSRQILETSQREMQALRDGLMNGSVSRQQLREALFRYPDLDDGFPGKDNADALFDGIFGTGGEPKELSTLKPEMVQFAPTPLCRLDKMIHDLELSPEDVVYDLGCGTGRAAMFLRLMTDAALVIGVEYELGRYLRAVEIAGRFGFPGLEFQNADVQEIDLSAGTVFYMFNPFHGQMLKNVMERLREAAEDHTITVCTFFMDLKKFDFLHCILPAGNMCRDIAIYRSGDASQNM